MATPHRLFQALLLAAIAPAAAATAHAHPGPGDSPEPVPGLTYELSEVAPGVFSAIAHGVPYYVANSVVIVGEDGVFSSTAGPARTRPSLSATPSAGSPTCRSGTSSTPTSTSTTPSVTRPSRRR